MQSLADSFAELGTIQLVQVTVLIVAVAIVAFIVGRRRPHLSYLLWMLVIVKCLTPPVWGSPAGVFSWMTADTREVGAKTVAALENVDRSQALPRAVTQPAVSGPRAIDADASPRASEPDVRGDARPPFVLIAFWIWLAGAALMAAAIVWRYARVMRLAGSSAAPVNNELAQMLDRLRKQLGIRRRVSVCVVDAPVGPATLGIFRPTIVLPAALIEGAARERLEHLLAHELLHVRRGDVVAGWLQAAAGIVWWFYPPVWWASRQASRAREQCVDEAVVAELKCRPAGYARSLLSVAELKVASRFATSMPCMRPYDITAHRLQHILRTPRHRALLRRTPRWCWAVLLVAAVVTLPGAGLDGGRGGDNIVAKQDGDSQEPFRVLSSGKTYVLGEYIPPKALDARDPDLPQTHLRAVDVLDRVGVHISAFELPNGRRSTVVTIQSGTWRGTAMDLQAIKDLSGPLVLHVDCQATSPNELAIIHELPDLWQLTLANATDELVVVVHDLAALEYLVISGSQVTDAATANIRDLPSLEILVLSLPEITDKGLLALSEFPKLRQLQMHMPLSTDAGLRILARYPGIHYLQVGPSKCTDKAFQDIAALDKLESLVVEFEDFTGTGVKYLPADSKLKSLIGSGKLGDSGCAAIAPLPSLRRVALSAPDVTAAGLDELASIAALEHLSLYNLPERIEPDDLARLAVLQNLDVLGVSGNCRVNDDTLAAFATMTGLRHLNLHVPGITENGFRNIGRLTNLRDLWIGNANLSDEALAALEGLGEMRQLLLDSQQITGSGLGSLAGMPKLRYLSLSFNPITDEGLSQLPVLPSLRQLDLNGTKLNDAGLAALAKQQRLENLNVTDTEVTKAGVERLQESLPRLSNVQISDPEGPLTSFKVLIFDSESSEDQAPAAEVPDQTRAEPDPVDVAAPVAAEQDRAGDSVGGDAKNQLPDSHHRAAEVLRAAGADVQLYEHDGGAGTVVSIGTQWKGPPDAIEAILELSSVQRLVIDCNVAPEIEGRFLRGLPKLSSLFLLNASTSDLAQVGDLKQLDQFDVRGSGVTDLGLAAVGKLPRLRVLQIDNAAVTDDGLAALAKFPNLRFLIILGCTLTDKAFGRISVLANLEQLILIESEIDGRGAGELANNPKLNFLSFQGCPISDEGCKQIGSLQQLKRLAFDADKLSDDGVANLSNLQSLETLILGELPDTITPAGLTKLASLKNLRTLSLLGECRLNPSGMNAIGRIAELRTLNLFVSGIDDDGFRQLAPLSELTSLSLGRSTISDESLDILSGMRELRLLELVNAKITGRGLSALEGLDSLTRLSLSGNPLNDEGLENLPALPSLKVLNLDYTQIGDAALRSLGRQKALERLDIIGTKVTPAGAEALEESLPALRTVYLSREDHLKSLDLDTQFELQVLDPEEIEMP